VLSSTNINEYKRVNMLMHNQQVWKAILDFINNEQCYSLSSFKSHERIFAACTSPHNARTMKIYDRRGY